MIIVGAKGFAKEILEICHQNNQLEGIVFYDDISENKQELLYDRFSILKNMDEVKNYFLEFGREFTIGIGNPKLRKLLYQRFSETGGVYSSTVSNKANIGSYDVSIGEGVNILTNAIISNSTKIGRGAIVYYNVVIAHDAVIDEFVELSPNAQVLGRCKIGAMTHIGANATILPDIIIGENVIIGAGAVVTKDIPSNCVAMGVPARVVKQIEI